MPFDKFSRIWANSGTKTAPTTGKQDLGWVNDEQVPYEWLNWLQDKIEAKVQEIIIERVNSYNEYASDWKDDINTRLWSDSWALPGNDAANTISGGATKQYIDLASYVDTSGASHLMVLDVANTKIEVWDPRAKTLESTSGDLSSDLPSGGGQTWEPYSMCTDGIDVFVLFKDTNASPDTHQIQAWTISTWNVKSGWNATGTALTGTGNSPLSNVRDGYVIIADGTNLATITNSVQVTAASDAVISIITRAAGTITAEGAGDCSIIASQYGCSDIVSDGTYIYFMATDTTPALSFLCSAAISNPQTGSGGSNWPYSAISGTFRAQFCMAGPNLGFVFPQDGSAIEFRTFNAGDGDLDHINLGQDSQGTPLTADKYIINNVYDVVFDGINIWVFGDVNSIAGLQFVLVKFDAARVAALDITNDKQLPDIVAGVYLVDSENTIPGISSDDFVCSFDGRDIWMLVESRASQTNSGKIFRLPLALLRG